jgi:2-polyprenyl-6-methoxyphenol hydroxylase-like FAD-dependent oxidoreductase
MQGNSKTYDAIIVGGGVVGMSIAYHLVHQKVDTLPNWTVDPLARRHRWFVGQTKHRIGYPALETLVVHELLEKFRIVVHHLYNHDP